MSNDKQGSAIDLRQFIDQQKISGFQWRILVLCFLIVALDGLDTAAIGFIAPSLRNDWGLDMSHLTPILAAALAGLTLGAFISGPLADRWGRKKILLGSVAMFGLWSLLSYWADSMTSLTAMRFLTGLGLGGAMPNAVTLMSEYCPQRRRSVLVTTMFCGFTLGSAMGGIIASWMIPAFGWRSILLLGGVLPLALLPLLAALLPESAGFLLLRGKQDAKARIAAILRRIGPLPAGEHHFVLPAGESNASGASPVALLLQPKLRMGTLLLWLSFFMSLLIIYLLTNWLPTLIGGTGLSLSQASLLTALFQIGGTIGSIVLGLAMDRGNPYKVLSLAYFLGALSIGAISLYYRDFVLLGVFVVCVGIFISGSQVGANALAAGFYPTASRATGVAWALGAGRFGSIFGSIFGGALLGMGWGMQGVFSLLMVPAALASLFILLMGLYYGRQSQAQASAA